MTPITLGCRQLCVSHMQAETPQFWVHYVESGGLPAQCTLILICIAVNMFQPGHKLGGVIQQDFAEWAHSATEKR